MNKTLVILTLALAAPLSFADPAPDFTALVAKTKDAVVSIEVESRVSAPSTINGFPPEIFEDFFGIPDPFGQQFEAPREQRILQGQGSGFIIDSDGYILTNAHVVEGAEKVRVQLNNNKEYNADVIGLDKRTDVALVKIQGDHLPVAKIGNSDQVQVGDWVLAIGSPFGFSHTATQGIVSAVARNLPSGDYVPFIQTDAAINPGNSGGPLFNSKGEVIAINSQIYSRSGAFNGLAFSIPINMAKNIADQLKDKGEVVRGWLGVRIQGLDQTLAEGFGMENPQGALVAEVEDNSPAAKAGIESGDVILQYNGKPVTKSADLPALVASTPIGEKVEIKLLRDGKEETVKAEIGNLNDISGDGKAGASSRGLSLEALDSDDREALGFRGKGVRISGVKAGSAAEKSGLRKNDIIIAVGGKRVEDPKGAQRLLEKAGNKRPVPLLIYRNGQNLYLALQP
ncbi:DegQ family serine endoprotease [Cardiobacterium hominis]|uniref:DegQ family serine endoprotease n=1 Tax=Cardiobacterium hominis TaxID=2718 RepID=UPI0028D842D6|nr:DegQ family serine endoprotease [Cardiobacterium hominis]